MTHDEQEQTALMGGSAFQETGMTDYLTRVAEAVRDATLNKTWQIGNNGPLRSAVDLQATIASVPRPEPVAAMVPAGSKVWFSYDGDSGFDVHNTAEEARQTAQQAIDEYRDDADPDDGWPEQIENVCWGVVLDKTREVEIHDGYDGSAGLAGCGRPVDYVLASEPVATQVAAPDAQTVASAIRQRILSLPRFSFLSPAGGGVRRVPDRAGNWIEWDAAAALCELESVDAMLAAAPEAPHVVDDQFELTCPEPPARDDRKAIKRLSDAVSAICCQAGENEDEFTKWLADGGLLELLESGNKAMKMEKEITTLRSAIQAMASMLQAREWAEHVSADPDVTDLEAQITELVGTATKLREQNAALVAALKAISDQMFRAGVEFGGPLDVAKKEERGTRDEVLELALIADNYLESISLTAKQALASAKGGAT